MYSLDGFCLVVTGQLKSAEIRGCRKARCKYQIVSGRDWTLMDGLTEGVTQLALSGSGHRLVWNFPLSILMKSKNPFGWPQLVVAVYGLDLFGRDIIKGYGAVHLPTTAGHHDISVKLYKPKSSGFFQKLVEDITGMPPEFALLTFPSEKEGHDVVQTTSNGEVNVELNVLLKDFSPDCDEVGKDDTTALRL